jgi:hypothetical protein
MSPTDYIMRLIEQFALVLARILFKKNAHEYNEALFEIGNAYGQLLGLDIGQVHLLSDDELIEWLKIGGGFDAEKCMILAALQKEEAEIIELAGPYNGTESSLKFYKAFSLYMEALLHDGSLGTVQVMKDIRAAAEKTDFSGAPPRLRYKLFRYLELAGDFGRAEDVLYELIRETYPDILNEGRAFYRRLLEKSDDELKTGRLPRKEAEEGLSAMSKKGYGK